MESPQFQQLKKLLSSKSQQVSDDAADKVTP